MATRLPAVHRAEGDTQFVRQLLLRHLEGLADLVLLGYLGYLAILGDLAHPADLPNLEDPGYLGFLADLLCLEALLDLGMLPMLILKQRRAGLVSYPYRGNACS